jgi:hypothetical protein
VYFTDEKHNKSAIIIFHSIEKPLKLQATVIFCLKTYYFNASGVNMLLRISVHNNIDHRAFSIGEYNPST